jgi:carbonic anhydrase
VCTRIAHSSSFILIFDTMEAFNNLIARNAHFASSTFSSGIKMMPSLKTVIIGCVDPRVDPVDLLGLKRGEAAVVRNVGGRINDEVIDTLSILHRVAQKGGGRLGPGWNIIVLHHNDCGITRVVDPPEQLAHYLGVDAAQLDSKAVTDPYASVVMDVAALKASDRLPGGFLVTGLVYDVNTGKIETIVEPQPAPMRS